MPLITASILSKKLAEGIDGLVMDVKCGRAAFLKTPERAQELMRSIVDTGTAAGLDVTALLTDMDTPLGAALGNALEVVESIDALRGGGPADLREVTVALGAEMLVLAGQAPDPEAARGPLEAALDNGSALDCFARNLERQGGDPRILEEPGRLPAAPVVRTVASERAGVVHDIDPLALGHVVVDLGGGRRQPEDRVDPAVGLVLAVARGDAVAAGAPLCAVHAADEAAAHAAAAGVLRAISVGEGAVPARELVQGRYAGVTGLCGIVGLLVAVTPLLGACESFRPMLQNPQEPMPGTELPGDHAPRTTGGPEQVEPIRAGANLYYAGTFEVNADVDEGEPGGGLEFSANLDSGDGWGAGVVGARGAHKLQATYFQTRHNERATGSTAVAHQFQIMGFLGSAIGQPDKVQVIPRIGVGFGGILFDFESGSGFSNTGGATLVGGGEVELRAWSRASLSIGIQYGLWGYPGETIGHGGVLLVGGGVLF